VFLFPSDPDLVVELASLLSLLMLERAGGVQARVEFAGRFDVSELAVRCSAVRTVAAEWHGRMSEGTVRVGAIREELAVQFGLVSDLLSR